MAERRARVRPDGWRLAGWLGLAAALLALVGWPLGRLLGEGLGDGPATLFEALEDAGAGVIWNSTWTSILSAALATLLGLGAALLTTRWSFRGRRLLGAALLVPLLVPDFVAAIGWTRAYGPAGLLQRLAGLELPGLYGPAGIVAVLVTNAVPLAYLVIAAGMRVRAEPDLERAARGSGATAWVAFRSVSLPLLTPVLGAAAALVFVTSMNAFGVPAVLGRPAGFATITTRIYQDLALSGSDEGFLRVIALAGLLLTVAVGLVAVADRLAPEAVARTADSSGSARGSRAPHGLPLLGWAYAALAVVGPLVAVLLTALTRAVGLDPVPPNLTLANLGRALDSHALGAMGNSLLLATGTAAGAVALSALALAVTRAGWRGRIASLVTVSFAMPGSVLAIAVLLAYGASLRDTLGIIGLAYLAKLWALAHRPLAGALDRVPADLARAARIHGASPLTALRTVTLPILAPAVAAAALLVFVVALHEVTISILLYGPSTATLAVVVLNLQQLGDPTLTSALAVVLTLLVVGIGGVAALLLRRADWIGAA